jgi:hypothetical protein
LANHSSLHPLLRRRPAVSKKFSFGSYYIKIRKGCVHSKIR